MPSAREEYVILPDSQKQGVGGDTDEYNNTEATSVAYIEIADTMQTPSVCKDVDECMQETHNCHTNADCFNLPGTFQCRCKAGYQGNGRSDCVEVTTQPPETMATSGATTEVLRQGSIE